MKLLVRWAIVSLSLFVAAWLVPGIRVEPNAWFVYAVMAVILGLVNAVVRALLDLPADERPTAVISFTGAGHRGTRFSRPSPTSLKAVESVA